MEEVDGKGDGESTISVVGDEFADHLSSLVRQAGFVVSSFQGGGQVA